MFQLNPLPRVKLVLALKAPNKNCSSQHFNFLPLSSKKIRLDVSSESSA